MPDHKPVILLASADARGELPAMHQEARGLDVLFRGLKQQGKIEYVPLSYANLNGLYQALNVYRDRIAIVHYAGHADAGRLMLEAALESPDGSAHAEGLAEMLGSQRGLKLVFLNGCSTLPQVDLLLGAGVPAVIATSRAIKDCVARDFAIAFYNALTVGSEDEGLRAAQTIAEAFASAAAFVKTGYGKTPTALLRSECDLRLMSSVNDVSGMPREGKDQIVLAAIGKVIHIRVFDALGEKVADTDERHLTDKVLQIEDLKRELASLWPPHKLSGDEKDRLVAVVTSIFGERVRNTKVESQDVHELSEGLPWLLRPGSGVNALRWNLFQDDPLFGLPPLPQDIPYPTVPVRRLEWFRKVDARIFFGRGRAIRALYDAIVGKASPPIILYYGATGVGKSSVLHAGVTPRLEADHRVVYKRRDPNRGLLGTLRDALAAGPNIDIAESWRTREQDCGKPLIVVLDQVEEAFTRPMVAPATPVDAIAQPTQQADSQAELNDLAQAIRGLGLATGRPRGKLVLSFRKEWLQEIEQALNAATISDCFTKKISLYAMGGDEIRETVEGPDRDPSLAYLDLEIDDELPRRIMDDLMSDPNARAVIAPTLQVILSQLWDQVTDNNPHRYTVDLYNRLKGEGLLLRDFLDKQQKLLQGCDLQLMSLANDASGMTREGKSLIVVAVVSKILRFRIFDSDGKIVVDADEASLPDKAQKIEDLERQLGNLWPPHVLTGNEKDRLITAVTSIVESTQLQQTHHDEVENGFDLELLEAHTTAWGTARSRSRANLGEQFSGQGARLEVLLRKLKNLYLLVDPPADPNAVKDARVRPGVETSLAHDALAPLVQEKHRASSATAQRARRLLENRAGEWKDGKEGTPLDSADLALVEAGLPWVRTLENHERSLIEASRDAEKRRVDKVNQQLLKEQSLRRLRDRMAIAACVGLLIALVAAVAFWIQRRKAETQTTIAVEQTRNAKKKARIAESRRLAALSDLVRPKRLDQAMLLALEASVGDYVEDTLEARASLQRCIDDRPEVSRFLAVPEGVVTSVAVSLEGAVVAGYTRIGSFNLGGEKSGVVMDAGGYTRIQAGGVVLFDDSGRRLRPEPIEIAEGEVRNVAFGPGDMVAVGYSCTNNEDFDEVGGVVLLGAMGERLWAKPSKLPEGGVRSVAFGPGGTIVAAFDAGLVLLDPKGDRLPGQPIRVAQGQVTSVAFSRQGTIAAGYRFELSGSPGKGRGGVVLLDAKEQWQKRKTIEIAEGRVTSVAFGSDGTIAAGFDHDNLGGFSDGGFMLINASDEPRPGRVIDVTEGPVSSVAFGPENRIAVGYNRGDGASGSVLLRYGSGEQLWEPIQVPEGLVTSVAFGRDRTVAVAYGRDSEGGGGVVLLQLKKTRIRSKSVLIPDGPITSVAVSRGDTIAAGYCGRAGYTSSAGGVALLTAKGERLATVTTGVKEGAVTSVAFGPDGMLAAGYTRAGDLGCVVVLDAKGVALPKSPIEVKNGGVTSVAFGPDGIVAAGYYQQHDGAGGVVLLDMNGVRPPTYPIEVKGGGVTSVAFGPGGVLAAGHSHGNDRGSVVALDARGTPLPTSPIEVDGGGVRLAFGISGTIAVGYSRGNNDAGLVGGVILLDAKGKRLWDGPVEFAQCVVSSVAIGLDDTIAVGESHVRDERGYVGGVVLLDANGERLRPDPIEVSGESVSSVAFSSSRTIAAGESELLLIDGNPASWRDKLERVANRNLTWAEWRQFFPVTRETKAIYRRTIQAFDLPRDLPEPERTNAKESEKAHPPALGDASVRGSSASAGK